MNQAFTCPHCGGPIAFDPAKDSMLCPYCDSEITVIDYRNALKDGTGRILMNDLSCPQCGAHLLTTDTTTATFCSYCGSSVALTSRLTEVNAPDKVIPFKVSKNKATKIYKDRIHKTLLAPDWMESDENTSHFRGIYMPFHVFNFHHEGRWEGEVTDTRIEHTRGKDYDVTRTYDMGAEVLIDYDYIPVDASTAFPDSMSRAVCPYKRDHERDFELPYYAGFYADRGDVDAALYEEKYGELVRQDVKNKSTISCGGVQVPAKKVTEGIEMQAKTKTSMFPVWFLSIRNKERVNYACVNGDTGELVCDIPIDFGKFLVASLIVAGLFSIILNLLFTIKPNNLLVVTSIIAVVAYVIANNLLNDTYRRIKRYDDPGYTGIDVDKVVEQRRWVLVLKTIGNILIASVVVLVLLVLAVALDLPEGVIDVVLIGAFIGMPAYTTVTVSRIFAKKTSIKRRNAPFWYKLLVLAKPMLAVAAAMVVWFVWPYVDEYCWIAAAFAIVMIIWTAFDVVRAQNRFTMRDLPLFNEKRGGEA